MDLTKVELKRLKNAMCTQTAMNVGAKMRYNTIRQMDIANGPGCRVSIFVQGCEFNCPGCFNSVAKDFTKGTEFTDQTMDLLLELAKSDHIAGISDVAQARGG